VPATNIAKLAIQIEAQGGDQVIGHIGRIGAASEGLNLKFARVGSHIAEATGRLSSMESVGVGSISRLVVGVAEFAGYFGPAGLVISGVAAASGVIVSMFSKAREEAKKTREAFDDEIAKMLDSGDRAGLMKQARDLFQGTPAKDFADGLQAMQTKLQSLKDTEAERYKLVGVFATAVFKPQIDALQKQIDDRQAQIAKIEAMMSKVDSRTSLGRMGTVTVTADDPAKRAAAELKAANELFAQENAFRDAWVAAGKERMALELSIEANYIAQGQAMLDQAIKEMGQTPEQQAAKTARETIEAINMELDKGSLIPDLRTKGTDISSAIVSGFSAGFQGHGIGDALESATGEILSGLGSMMIRMAGPIIIFGKLMTILAAALKAHPIFAGAIAIAVGAALLALGSSLSSAATGGSGGSGGGINVTGAGTANNPTQETTIILTEDGKTPAPAPAPVPIPSPLPTPISKGTPAPIAVPSPVPIASLARTPIATAPPPLATVAPMPLASAAPPPLATTPPAPLISVAPRTINVTPPAPIVNIARAPITLMPATSASRMPPDAISGFHQETQRSVPRVPITNTRLASTGAAAASRIKPLTPLSFGPFIGTNDGRAQRDIMELINAALGRGYTFGT
jgi:hypothetical protein